MLGRRLDKRAMQARFGAVRHDDGRFVREGGGGPRVRAADSAKEIAMVAVAATWRRAIGLLGYGAT